MAARGLARVTIIGNLGRDAELQYLPSGKAKATFRVAVNRRERAADGTWSDVPDWFGVVAWDRLAERCGEHLTKGTRVCVDGRLVTRTYTDRQGSERTVVEIIAHDVLMVGTPAGSAPTAPADRPAAAEAAGGRPAALPPVDGEDIPF